MRPAPAAGGLRSASTMNTCGPVAGPAAGAPRPPPPPPPARYTICGHDASRNRDAARSDSAARRDVLPLPRSTAPPRPHVPACTPHQDQIRNDMPCAHAVPRGYTLTPASTWHRENAFCIRVEVIVTVTDRALAGRGVVGGASAAAASPARHHHVHRRPPSRPRAPLPPLAFFSLSERTATVPSVSRRQIEKKKSRKKIRVCGPADMSSTANRVRDRLDARNQRYFPARRQTPAIAVVISSVMLLADAGSMLCTTTALYSEFRCFRT